MGRKRYCELPFCKGVVEGTRNKRRCDNDRNIHLHQVISKSVRKIMKYVQGHDEFTANNVARDLFKNKLDKNEKGSMYRLFQAMVRENYLLERGKREGLKVYAFSGTVRSKSEDDLVDELGEDLETDHGLLVPAENETDVHHLTVAGDTAGELRGSANVGAPRGGDADPLSRGRSSGVSLTPASPFVGKPVIVESIAVTAPIPEVSSPLSRQDLLLGKLREFVYQKNGHWDHDDWLWLINRPDIREFGEPESEVGRLLEEEKIRFWTRR
ncbi:MAG: hypothetical protein WA705_10685 [Candidatus Ozemobacteraceae bacterium]